ncbi:hypothetical protein PoB_005959800 [Plakobranchus ocellatus]|uniref:Uncharacterized protein n=1 Tax=Plakobranchus ocellatus TaxID=259542 RepID=A0AAV4CMF0_9GAST|nr:hypothetical protein PoB_005959800 [Plakobranchus ocellatus]
MGFQASVSTHRAILDYRAGEESPSTTRSSEALGLPSGQGAGGEARTRDRRIPPDLRVDSLATVPPTPEFFL